jgi:hypothetical protein
MTNRKPETENGKPEIRPDRFSFPVSRFRFPVSSFLPAWFPLVRVRTQRGSAATDCGFRIAKFGLVVPKIFARRKDFRK